MDNQTSPLPEEIVEGENTMTFPEAMQKVKEGKKVASLYWRKESQDYALLKDGQLQIYRSTGNTFHQWLINDGDILAEDWVVVE